MAVSLIDTHCHAYASAFDGTGRRPWSAPWRRVWSRLLLPNIDAASIGPLLDLGRLSRPLFSHDGPCTLAMSMSGWEAECAPILDALDAEPCIAVGEIGMDLFRGRETRDAQIAAFHVQIGWALERDLPVVLHVRDAFEDTFAVLDQYTDTALRGVFHCFTGGPVEAEKVVDYGRFCFGLGGVTTFKNGGLDRVVPHLPHDRILLETDSPYLAPTPYRGKRNEPAYTRLVAQRVADLMERSLEEVAALTTANAERLFRLPAFEPHSA